jgi:lipoprotein-anchoring transpeptidase ErfK/SrfK
MPPTIAAAVLTLAVVAGVAVGHPSSASARLTEQVGAPDSSSAPLPGFVSAPDAKAKPRQLGYLVLRPAPGHELIVRSSQGGPVIARLRGRTEFGSPQTAAVVRKHGRWLGVVTTHAPNGRLGWVDARDDRLRYTRTRLNLVIDLSDRQLVLRSGRGVIRRVTVGVGRPTSPTPLGRFAITDKLSGPAFSSYYGCCILALSAHQPSLPAGWRGGDRIAIHGTYDLGSIGAASTAGCVRAESADLQLLMRRVPLGAPVFIHP